MEVAFRKLRDDAVVPARAYEGDAGLEPRSRRPHGSPNRTPVDIEEEIVKIRKDLAKAGHEAGAATIAVHLEVVTATPRRCRPSALRRVAWCFPALDRFGRSSGGRACIPDAVFAGSGRRGRAVAVARPHPRRG